MGVVGLLFGLSFAHPVQLPPTEDGAERGSGEAEETGTAVDDKEPVPRR